MSTEAAGKKTGRVLQTLRGHDLSGQGQGLSEGAKDGCFAFFSVVKASRYPREPQSSVEEFIYYLSLSLEDHLRAPGLLPLLVQDRIQTCVTGRMFLAVLKKKIASTDTCFHLWNVLGGAPWWRFLVFSSPAGSRVVPVSLLTGTFQSVPTFLL